MFKNYLQVQWRRWRASWRDTWLLLRQFARPLFLFVAAMLGSGWLYFVLSIQLGEPLGSLAEAVYLTLSLSFLQASMDFPQHFALQAFYFVMPVVGLGLLATGLTDFAVMLFNRRARSKEWEMAVASTFTNHTVLMGLGHLGFRVTQNLHKMQEPVVVIDIQPTSDLLSTVQAMNIPVLVDDATRLATLEAAGVRQAKTIVLCSQEDSLNLQVALKARSLNPNIRVVIRIFDEEFAASLQQQFGFQAYSATSMAAPAFAASAAGADITRPITVEGESLSLARLKVEAGAKFRNLSVSEVEKRYNLSIILLKHAGEPDMHPSGKRSITVGDTLVALGNPESLNIFVHDSQ